MFIPPAVTLYADAGRVLAAFLGDLPPDVVAVVADVRVAENGGTRDSLQADFCVERLMGLARAEGVCLLRGDAFPGQSGVDPWDVLADMARRFGEAAIAHLPMPVGLREGAAPDRDREIPGIPPALPAVSVIIPTRDRPDLLRACLDSLPSPSRFEGEIIIVDNGSVRPDTLALLAEAAAREGIRVIRHDIPFNFSRLCNLGAAAARHDSLLFLNDDIECLDDRWLDQMRMALAQPGTGVAGARLLYESGDLQHAGIATHLVPGPGHPWRGLTRDQWSRHPWVSAAGQVDAVTAACLLIDRGLFDTLGGFDEDAFPITLNDVDLCLRVRAAGRKVMYVPEATLMHREGQSRPRDDSPEQRARRQGEINRFVEKYPGAARLSKYFPATLRRDSDSGESIGA